MPREARCIEGSPLSGWLLVNLQNKIKTAGGCPAASYFLLLRQNKVTKEKATPGLPPLRGTLDQPQASGAAQLDLVGRTPRAPLRDSNSARLNLRSLATDRGGAQGKEKQKMLCALRAQFCFAVRVAHATHVPTLLVFSSGRNSTSRQE